MLRRGSWPPLFLFELQPELNAYKQSVMHPVVITARDGLRLPSYLTLPLRADIPETLPPSVTGLLPSGSADEGASAAAPAVQKSSTRSVHFATPAQLAAAAAPSPLNLSLPLVLRVHGGPWERDTWGADAMVQFLANRGYAVLQVNFRGSSGFGKNFLNAGNKQWGVGAMQHDLSDAVKWAVAKGIADPAKVCIFGASYGGYATLAGLTFTPELYRCG
jgi:acetyl esterase/lipase